MIRRCCCNPTECEGTDCAAARADCATNGIQPFRLKIGARLDFTSCQKFEFETIQCTNPNCATWGSSLCGGCSPCDPNGTAPGAAGRTCPCRDQDCEHPQYQDWPYEFCVDPGSPLKNREGCRWWNPSFWYLEPYVNAPDECSVATVSPCDWLGSVSCAFNLVQVPGRFQTINCESIEKFNADVLIDRISQCPTFPPVFPIPELVFPQTSASGIYGWPNGAPCVDDPPCFPLPPCYCSCNGGFFPFKVIGQDTPTTNVCNPDGGITDGMEFRILSLVPCADNLTASLECGGACECAESVIQIEILGYTISTPRRVFGNSGSLTPFDPTDPASIEAHCHATAGDPAATPPGSDCSGTGTYVPDCLENCCQCQRSIVLTWRRKKSSTLNLCQMEPGVYELAGIGVCDGEQAEYGCGADPETDPACIPAHGRCNGDGYLRGIAELKGWTNLYLEVF